MGKKTLSDRALLTLVKTLFHDPQNAATAFSTPYKIYKHLKDKNYKISLGRVRTALEYLDTYTLHKRPRARFKREPTLARGIDYLHQIDLVDLSKYAKSNDSYKWLLTLICVFSKRISIRALKSKSNDEVIRGLKLIYKTRPHPRKIQSDAGVEFLGKKSKEFMRSLNIIHYVSQSQYKAAVIERANRSILELISKYMTSKNSKRYLEFLPQVEHIMNNRYHRSIKMSPNQVSKVNERQVWKNLYSKYFQNKVKSEKILAVGTPVRISKYRHLFTKGYIPTFTKELFKIAKVKRDPQGGVMQYYLRDLNNQEIIGKFYYSDLSVARS